MPYLDSKFIVMPLGLSCQSAQQIDMNAGNIAHHLGSVEFEVTSTYFDWLITPSQALSGLLSDNLPHPLSESEISLSLGAPMFEPYGALFYHEMHLPDGRYEKTEESFEQLVSKFRYLSDKTRRLIETRRPLFVWSNTQNDLENVVPHCRSIDLILDMDTIYRIAEAADGINNGPADYLFVTYEDRSSNVFDEDRFTIVKIEPDESLWQGDNDAWAHALAKAIDKMKSRMKFISDDSGHLV